MEIIGLDKIKHLDEKDITGLDKIKKEPDLPYISQFAVKMIELVNRARELDTDCREFGSSMHKYSFNPVIPISKVRDFEKRHKIKIPQGYVDFLTQVGNGGAGPDYGLYSLERIEEECYYDHKYIVCPHTKVRNQPDFYTFPYSIDGKEPMVNSRLTLKKWDDWYSRFHKFAEDDNEKACHEMYPEAYNGLIQIVDSGCCTGYMLVCKGDLEGEVAAFQHELEAPAIINMKFEDWVLEHFKRIIAKYEYNSSADVPLL